MREESNLSSGADEERAAVQSKQRWGGQKEVSCHLACLYFFVVCFALRNQWLLNSLVYIFTEWAENLLRYSFLLRNDDLMELKCSVGMVGGLPSCFALLLAAGHPVCSPSCLSCGPAALALVSHFKYLYILTNKTANHQLKHQLAITT